jgi:hypothetical protein
MKRRVSLRRAGKLLLLLLHAGGDPCSPRQFVLGHISKRLPENVKLKRSARIEG